MTLLEALAYIQSAEKCDPVAAQVHLKQAIGHRVIPVKWADSKGLNDKPDVANLQRSQLVLSGHGLASGGRSLRPLLALRSAVHATWPRTTGEGGGASEANSGGRRSSVRRKYEEKYRQWMTLVEAIEHIRMSQDCDSAEALCQLKGEMNEGMIRAQWDDSEGPKDCPDPKYLQASQLWLIGTGVAPDNVHETYRPLLVERSTVQELWPLSKQWPKDPSQTTSASTTQHQMPVHRPASEDEIVRAARELYQQPGKPPNLAEAEKLLMDKLSGTSREPFIRPVLKRKEFEELRLKRGNQRKT